mgnify:CR=1 FL=1
MKKPIELLKMGANGGHSGMRPICAIYRKYCPEYYLVPSLRQRKKGWHGMWERGQRRAELLSTTELQAEKMGARGKTVRDACFDIRSWI